MRNNADPKDASLATASPSRRKAPHPATHRGKIQERGTEGIRKKRRRNEKTDQGITSAAGLRRRAWKTSAKRRKKETAHLVVRGILAPGHTRRQDRRGDSARTPSKDLRVQVPGGAGRTHRIRLVGDAPQRPTYKSWKSNTGHQH